MSPPLCPLFLLREYSGGAKLVPGRHTAGSGRTYPASGMTERDGQLSEDRDAGITASDPVAVLSDPAIGKACAPVVERAKQHFAQAEKIMAKSARRTVKTPRIMAAAYRMMLDRMVAQGWQAPRTRVKLRKRQFVWILLRYALV